MSQVVKSQQSLHWHLVIVMMEAVISLGGFHVYFFKTTS
jgi:hypothetical protein